MQYQYQPIYPSKNICSCQYQTIAVSISISVINRAFGDASKTAEYEQFRN